MKPASIFVKPAPWSGGTSFIPADKLISRNPA